MTCKGILLFLLHIQPTGIFQIEVRIRLAGSASISASHLPVMVEQGLQTCKGSNCRS